ncbi:DUF4385 family protein [Pedobacter sp. PWIIR3]
MANSKKPSYLDFDQTAYGWKADIDYRKHPELYRVGKGEQGVLICEPYKSEIGPHWRFKTPEIAEESSSAIYNLFKTYLKDREFVGADLARKYLQMGYTRARRYANYRGEESTIRKMTIMNWNVAQEIRKKLKRQVYFIRYGRKPKLSQIMRQKRNDGKINTDD